MKNFLSVFSVGLYIGVSVLIFVVSVWFLYPIDWSQEIKISEIGFGQGKSISY